MLEELDDSAKSSRPGAGNALFQELLKKNQVQMVVKDPYCV
jgi:hypothetical protein